MVEKILVTFLGTGSAIPTARRNHSAILLQYKRENILVDCGEGTQRQFRKAQLNPGKITKILISHWHGDHTLGLPGLLQTMILNGRNEKLDIYGPRGTKKKLKEIMDVFMGWYFDLNNKIGRGFEIAVHEVSGWDILKDKDFYIEVANAKHGVSSVAYSFVVKEKNRLDKDKLNKLEIPNSSLIGDLAKGKIIEIGGKRIDGKKLIYKEVSRKVVFIMDTKYNDEAVELSKDADLLISEASYSKKEQDTAEEYGHMTSVDAAKIAKKAKVKALVLVHLSQRYDAIPKVILNEAKIVFEDVIVAEDFDRIEL